MSAFEERLNDLLNNPEEMGKLTRMAQSLLDGGALGNLLGGDSTAQTEPQAQQKAPESPPGLPDGEMLASLGRMLSGTSAGRSDKTALLEAMKPYLSQKRRDKMDRAMKLAQMARLAGLAFSAYGGNKDGL